MATLAISRARCRGASALWAAVVALAASAGCTHIPPGRYAIDSVEIEGTGKVEAAEVEDKIATAASPRFLGLFRGMVLEYELFDPYILERDLARIERLYRARGFYEAHARAGRVEKIDESHVRVTVAVEEGPAVKVRAINVQGITTLPIDDAAAAVRAVRRRLRIGRDFDEERYETAQDELLHAFTDRGYAFAKVEGRVEVDLARHAADVFFDVKPGQQARLGSLSITGLGSLPEPPVRRALDLAEGDVYSAAKLAAAKRAVLALGVFAEAEVEPDLSRPDSPIVPVKVVVTPSELRTVKVGGGIELDVIRTGAHGLAGWEDRNFLGGMRRFNIDVRPGIVLYPTRVPRFEPPQEVLFEGRARAEMRQPGVIEARTGGTVRAEINVYPVLVFTDADAADAPTSNFIPGYLDLSASYALDRSFGPFYANLSYNFQNSFPFSYGDDLQNFRKVVLSYLDLKTTLDFRNDPIRPRSGIFVSNDFQVAGLPVTPNFRGPGVLFAEDLRLQPEVRGYIPLSRRWTLALRASTGFLLPFASSYGGSLDPTVSPNTDDIQLVFFRGFFSGGPNSNRGYPYRGVGPKGNVSQFLPGVTDLFFPTGGATLWEASVEVRFPISGDLGGVAFCDASDVSRYRFDIRLLYPHISCGSGIRYDTPVGAIGLDLGFPIPGAQSFHPDATPADKVPRNTFAISIGMESR
jgi:outer membrane protein insertion porin family/translocation and assembly module TamA